MNGKAAIFSEDGGLISHRRCRLSKVLPKAGLNGFDWTFVQGSTFVLRLNFSAKNPRLRQALSRWQTYFDQPIAEN